MPDLLNALRRLYGEPGPEGILSPEEEAEARALAGVKAGLDALPKRRPDAATLAAVLALAADPPPALGDDPAEAAALAEVEAGLAALPRRRPDAAALEAVFAAAAGPSASPAADRPARRPTSRRRAAALGTAFVLLLAAASVLWIVPGGIVPGEVAAPPIAATAPQGEAASDDPQAEAAEPSTVLIEPLAEASPRSQTSAGSEATRSEATTSPSAGRPAPAQAAPPSAAPPPPAARVAAPAPNGFAAARSDEGAGADADLQLVSETMPFAEGDEALRLLYLRMLELQAAQAGLGWDEPPTALGTVPDSTPAASGWMRVRVER